MKRFFAFALLLLSSLRMQAQWDSVKTQEPVYNIVKLSPFHFVEGTFLLGYERIFGAEKNVSFMLLAGMHSRESNFQAEPSFGTLEELQFRYYVVPPQNRGAGGSNFLFFKGFYAGPFLYHRYRQQTSTVFDWIQQANVQVEENVNEVAGGVLLGVQVALGNRFYMDLYTGGGVKRSFGVAENPGNTFNRDVTDIGYNGVIPKIGFLIGVGL